MKYDIVIIGSGVAGLTSSIYCRLANKSTLIIENSSLGGTVASIDSIKNYPGFSEIKGIDLIEKIYMQSLNLGTEFLFDNIEKIDFNNNQIILKDKIIDYKALIIAGGLSNKKTKAFNEDKFFQKGISYCAVCDGNLYKNKSVVVITNGYIGKSSVEYLKNIVKDIKILNISDIEYNDKNAINNVNIKSFNGEEFLQSITFEINGNDQTISCDGCFISLGKETDLNLFDMIDSKNGFILSNEYMHTNIDGVFVAGDIRNTPLRQIMTACADGAIASTEAIKYTNKK